MSVNQISAQDAKSMLDNHSAILIDVREPAEHRQENIAGAHLVPLSQLDFSPDIADGKQVIVHCQKGVRGNKACEQLQQRYAEVTFLNMVGGIEAWRGASLMTVKGKSKVLALDRQVQLTIGTCVLTGVLLSQFVAPQWVWLSGFMGAGLIFAGLSGFCGLARVMALMPWNK